MTTKQRKKYSAIGYKSLRTDDKFRTRLMGEINLECLRNMDAKGTFFYLERLLTNERCARFSLCSQQTKERFAPNQEEPLAKEMWSLSQDLLRLKASK